MSAFRFSGAYFGQKAGKKIDPRKERKRKEIEEEEEEANRLLTSHAPPRAQLAVVASHCFSRARPGIFFVSF